MGNKISHRKRRGLRLGSTASTKIERWHRVNITPFAINNKINPSDAIIIIIFLQKTTNSGSRI